MLLSFAFVLAQKVICIDPGHPSEVGNGTHGKRTSEIHVAWATAQSLKKQLEKLGYRVVTTKSAEHEKVLNRRRAEIANEAHADLMIRLHCDGSTRDASNGTGFTVYYPSQPGTIDGFSGPAASVIESSRTAATKIHATMREQLLGKLADDGLKSDLKTAVGAKQGALTGSIYSKVPVVLVEMVVLTNPRDEAFILSKKGQTAMVDALTAGVVAAVH